MATLNTLKLALRQKAYATSRPTQPLSDTQHSAGFDILQSSGRATYQEFVIPQLSLLLTPLFNSRSHVSVLEIGPGPKSVLGSLPSGLRHKIKKYTAFEPNNLFATGLEEWLCSPSDTGLPLPCLGSPPDIHRTPFSPDSSVCTSGRTNGSSDGTEKFDVVLFCHSMYGMQPKRSFIERALDMLVEPPESGMVVVFHRDGTLHLDGLACHQTASFPAGIIDVADDDDTLNRFAPFVAGFVMQDVQADKSVRVEWRKVCRALGRREDAHPDRLLFSAPNIMAAFTRHATALPELAAQVPLMAEENRIKNREARLHRYATIVRPTQIQHVQDCVRWALNHGVGLTVIGGGHSGHCVWPHVVSVDMSAFDQVNIVEAEEGGEALGFGSGPSSLVVAGAGCKSGDVVRKAMAAGLTVPLGARPSVGAGLWLQGGIGHLARLYGLTSDAIVGAVVVSVASGQTLYIGQVPSQCRPAGAVRPENEDDLLWAIKGAGTNFGIVVSVTFKAYTAPTYSVRNWVLPLDNAHDARLKLGEFDQLVASELPRNCSADAYLYWDTGKLHLGVSMFEVSATPETTKTEPVPASIPTATILGLNNNPKTVDSVGLFDSEMYVSEMHGGHSGGKTSSFKRCVFLKHIGAERIGDILVAAIETRPSPLCYLHLLQGGGAVGDVAANATAFGCRDWDFACVITGVWPRDKDGTEAAQSAIGWVYDIARDLLPLSCGAYGADLGPDPRDAALAVQAFGPNRPRLARLKHTFDPRNILACACPLPKAPMEPQLIILVTGESGAGKDYCADAWASAIIEYPHKSLRARAVSISDAIKREYATATGADLGLLLSDRAYKEQHRPSLTKYFRAMVQQRPRLLQEQFLNVVYGTTDVDVLLIAGMRDEAPVATYSSLLPDSRLLEVHVQGSEEAREGRRGHRGRSDNKDSSSSISKGRPTLASLDYRPSFVFANDLPGNEPARMFAERHLFPFFHEDLQQLADMVRPVPDFPQPGVQFRHVLNISQQPGGLALCSSLLQTHFTGDWSSINALVCCETGGFVFASVLALRVGVPLVLVRDAGKLPPPTISVVKRPSNISSLAPIDEREKRVEMERDAVPRGSSVVVLDDVLATGETLCAVLQLLCMAGIDPADVSIMVVAEFPVHRGRELLRQRGFGRTHIQSLLVFGGA
ncbi:hypothetical protein ACRALDRAFT_1044157 [Sodiomyces alcalophilus JCM 7366]|uniref:uncharacterized protein n=1 Tax=Sodiomyces alcalophilus JCM 7366 TaxID=591952 RepID=UPI0039B504C7